MKQKFLCAAMMLVMAIAMIGAAPSAKTHYYTVEFCKPVKGSVPAMVEITFYENTGAAVAQKLLKTQLKAVLENYEPTDDVMCYAYLHLPGTQQYEDKQIGETDDNPIYSFKDKKIMLWREYEAAEKKK
jgi:hypothetical protein